MKDLDKMREVIRRAIEEFGVEQFKKTSLFLSNERKDMKKFKHITYDEAHGMFKATITIGGVRRFLGYFETPERARAVRNRVVDLMNERVAE